MNQSGVGLATVLAAAAAAVGQPCKFGWTPRLETGPAARYVAAGAFDRARQVLVVFGGAWSSGVGPYFGDTWEYNRLTTSWALRATTGPAARYGPAAVFVGTGAGGHVLMFGGSTQSSGLGSQADTWRWDGSAWAELPASGPPARYGAGMAYDSGRNRVVLFGGHAVAVPQWNDTWEWDGTQWLLASTSGPSPRGYPAMVYHAGIGKTLLFGGNTGTQTFGDTWVWDGQAWEQVQTGGAPAARLAASVSYDSLRARVVLFGGTNSQGASFGDMWSFATEWSPMMSPTMAPEARAGMVTGFDGDLVLVFGGIGASAVFDDLWEGYCEGGCYANCDFSTAQPVLNVVDFTCFLQKFAQQDPYANCDYSTAAPVFNVADFACFLQRFAQGCE